ncbi:F-box domain-containing protein [Heracleum sosnowskyi]|uniref:F-box domain-containing protein n=1 Tax=Heracleum sosnowskyi TaxID=360622 RepID=A0AAD8HQW0_9APIA|nr:F-box domain-containing protein [Heracleum sosnowskyi]
MKSNPMVLGFFRAQIQKKLQMSRLTKDKLITPDLKRKLGKIMKKKTSKLQMSRQRELTKDEVITPDLKRKLEKDYNHKMVTSNKQKKKKMMKLVDNTMCSTTSVLVRHGGKYTTTNQLTRNSDLPPDLLAEVLKRLPVKYVLRCRCVQKSWNFLIKTPIFITLHTNYQNSNRNRPKYLSFNAAYSDLMTIRFDDRQCEEYCRVKYLPDLPHSTWVAHSHGLFCVTYMFSTEPEKDGIYLWNPLVQKFATLPRSPLFGYYARLCLSALAFGFVPQFNDYVVVYLIKPHPKCCPLNHRLVKIAIYSLNNNSWKTISQDYVFQGIITMDRSVFVNGVAYWLGCKWKNCQILVCFDTKTHTLREILLPDWVETPWLGIHPFGQSIAYFFEDERAGRFDMWVLKGDSIDEFFWEKKMSIIVKSFCRTEVLGLRNNGEPIVFSFYNLLSYNLDSHEANDFVDSWNCWDDFSYYDYGMAPPFSISTFVESLALLNLD